MIRTARDDIATGSVAVLGIPLDENSSFKRGAARAPAAIRECLRDGASNYAVENGRDLQAEPRWLDAGDLELPADGSAFSRIEEAVAGILDRGARVLSLGGDHSVTCPIVRAYGARHKDLTIVHLDAHPDLYDELDGNRNSHACPFARIMEEHLCSRLIQLGIRTMNPHQREQADRFGVSVVPSRDWNRRPEFEITGPVYLSVDLDVLDPACAPGVSHHEPGGLTSRDVVDFIQDLPGSLVGADIVELNPDRDINGMTARLASKLLKEITARMLD